MKIHIVKKGDTLYDLSQKYHVELDKLIAANPQIADPDAIDVGMKVKIPSGATPVQPPTDYLYKHVVVQGDTLWKLGKAWGVPLADMVAANPQLKNPNILMTGDVVYIPKVKAAAQEGTAGVPTTNTSVPVEAAPISEQPPMPPAAAPPVENIPQAPQIPNLPQAYPPFQQFPVSPIKAGAAPAKEPELPVFPNVPTTMEQPYSMPNVSPAMEQPYAMPNVSPAMEQPYAMPNVSPSMEQPYAMPNVSPAMEQPYAMPNVSPAMEQPYAMPNAPMGMENPYAMPNVSPAMEHPYAMPNAPMGMEHPYAMPNAPMGMEHPYAMPNVSPAMEHPYAMPNAPMGMEYPYAMPNAPMGMEHPYAMPNVSPAMEQPYAMPNAPMGMEHPYAMPNVSPMMEHPYAMPNAPMAAFPGLNMGYPGLGSPVAMGDCGCGPAPNLPYALAPEHAYPNAPVSYGSGPIGAYPNAYHGALIAPHAMVGLPFSQPGVAVHAYPGIGAMPFSVPETPETPAVQAITENVSVKTKEGKSPASKEKRQTREQSMRAAISSLIERNRRKAGSSVKAKKMTPWLNQ